MANYNYSISSDFSNDVNAKCLDQTIRDSMILSLIGITIDKGNVKIEFDVSLSQEEEDELNVIIANHDPDECPEQSDVGDVIGVAGDASSLILSSTTSTTPIRKLRMTINDLEEGRYRIGWYYEWLHSSDKYDFRAQVELDDSLQLMYQSQEPKDKDTDQSYPLCGFSYQDLEEGTHFIDIDFWTEKGTAYIKNARLEIWRVV